MKDIRIVPAKTKISLTVTREKLCKKHMMVTFLQNVSVVKPLSTGNKFDGTVQVTDNVVKQTTYK